MGKPQIRGAKYQDAMASSRMALNLSRRSDNYLYSSDRMAHITGNGLLTFIDRATGFGDIYGEDELAFYSTTAELIERIRHFKAHDDERRAVARKGWAKSHAIFNERLVAQYILDVSFGKKLSHDYAWPTTIY
jgi:hypothetical protein